MLCIRVVEHTVFDYELEVSFEVGESSVKSIQQLCLHCVEVHGPFDHLIVVQAVVLDSVYWHSEEFTALQSHNVLQKLKQTTPKWQIFLLAIPLLHLRHSFYHYTYVLLDLSTTPRGIIIY